MTIPNFENAAVLIVGDVMLDRYWTGDSSRVSPEAPVPVVHVQGEQHRAGGAGNVALNVAALGAKATVLGLTGADAEAQTLEAILNRAGAQCVFEPVANCRTVTKLRVLSRHQQLLRMDFEDAFPSEAAERLAAHVAARLPDAETVVLSDYGKGALDAQTVQALIRQARAAGKSVLADPKGADFRRYRGASLLTPNRAEFEAVTGACADEADLVRRGMTLLQALELDALLVTRSEQGMSLLRREAEPLHLPTRAREVFDVTGAGDTVIATLAAGLAAGLDLPEATALANEAAGAVVGKLGAATVSVTELRQALHEPHGGGFGALDEGALAERLIAAKARGERIVMTNGVFDLLHAGHVTCLEQARALGDRLVVAVNDDASARRLGKGPGRPVNPLEQRMAVLAGLSAVDWVTSFAEDTPERLICRLRPDVLVKGGDYRPEEIAGEHCVTENGGEVKALPFVDGCSTTRIIERIVREHT